MDEIKKLLKKHNYLAFVLSHRGIFQDCSSTIRCHIRVDNGRCDLRQFEYII